MTDDLDAVLAAVGPRLRALRQQSATTLAELAATTGGADAQSVEVLSLFGRQGERAHLRARTRDGRDTHANDAGGTAISQTGAGTVLS